MNQFIKFNPAGTGDYRGRILNIDMIAGPVVQDYPAGNGDEFLGIPLKTGKNAAMIIEYLDVATATNAKKILDDVLYNSNPGVGTFEVPGDISVIEFSA